MTVVIDTNVLPGMFRVAHPFAPLLDAWFLGRFSWAVSTEILLEYAETVGRLRGGDKAEELLDRIEMIGGLRGNLHRISPTFRFRAIPADADDDKFADCAIAAEAEFIITEDGHFEALHGAGFKPQPITPEDFIRRHLR